MLHDVKSLLARLLPKRTDAQQSSPAPPTFDESELFEHLSAPRTVVEAWREGRRDAAWEALTAHFHRRVPALGFVAADRIPTLLADAERRFPAWRARLLTKVNEDRHQGLCVYDRRAGPLTAAFDWNTAAANPLEDRLYGVRPHRFGFLARWALACHYDGGLIAPLEEVLAGWMALAKQPGGHPAFKSSHVVVYHFVALLLAWPFLATLEDPGGDCALAALRRRALLILYEGSRHLRDAAGNSVANNHLLAERFADWLTAALLPEFDHAIERPAAEAAWLEELERQVFDDGGSFEHSVHYQEHGCEMAVAFLLLSRRNGWQIPQPSLLRIERMLAFQLTLAGPDLVPLSIGNTTEDPMLALGVGEGWQSGFLREVQRVCFTPEAPPATDEDPTRETAFWLLDGGLLSGQVEAVEEAPFQAFPESGFYLFVESETRARLILRLGPSPTVPGIGGHSHGDLLSLCLSIGGAMVLAPPGTYSYRFKPHPDLPGRPNLRAHFASASSRSGPFFEGVEPYGPLEGDFRNWRLPCQVEARQASAAAAGLSWVEGRVLDAGPYVDLRRGVVHVWGDYWLVYDRLPLGRDGPQAFVGWQFAPGVACRQQDDGMVEAQVTEAGARLVLQSCGTEPPDLASGSFEPFRGWVSPSYGRLEPAPNLRFALSPGSREATFLLTLEPEAEQRLEQVIAEDDSLGFRITAVREETLLLLNVAGESKMVRWRDVTFHGRLLCLSRSREGLRVRALGLERLTAPSWGLELTAHVPVDFELLLTEGRTLWPRGPCPQVNVERHHGGV